MSNEEIQWRNIQTAVEGVAKFCFNNSQQPGKVRLGMAYTAVTTCLTAKDGVQLDLEPLQKVSADDIKDAERYRKLRAWMSSNVKEGWDHVERLGAVAAWMGWGEMDMYLDSMPECNVGLCYKMESTTAPYKK